MKIPQLELKFEAANQSNQLPAMVLSQTVDGIQRAIHLLAMEHENRETRLRNRAPRDLEQKYLVMCSIPQPGSFRVPLSVGDPTSDFFAENDIVEVANKLEECFGIILSKAEEKLERLIPNPIRRLKILEALKCLVPKPQSKISLNIYGDGGKLLANGQKFFYAVHDFIKNSAHNEQTLQTITGKLLKIDFSEHKLTILYPVTNRELECCYDVTIEELLLENPRELIQVTGNVILDGEDNPKKIIDVCAICEVDASPIYLSEIKHGDKLLKFDQALSLEPQLDESKQFFSLTYPKLGIDTTGFTRADLEEELAYQIIFLWEVYACGDANKMTESAQNLKKALLENIVEV